MDTLSTNGVSAYENFSCKRISCEALDFDSDNKVLESTTMMQTLVDLGETWDCAVDKDNYLWFLHWNIKVRHGSCLYMFELSL